MIYWFVFGFGIRQRAPIGDVEYFQWLFAGILVWFFINQGVMKATKSIYQKIRMLSKMNFPMSVIPNYIVISQFYPHLILLRNRNNHFTVYGVSDIDLLFTVTNLHMLQQ